MPSRTLRQFIAANLDASADARTRMGIIMRKLDAINTSTMGVKVQTKHLLEALRATPQAAPRVREVEHAVAALLEGMRSTYEAQEALRSLAHQLDLL